MRNIRLVGIMVAVAALLSVPAIAMRFTDEVNWTALDFITMGVMLLATGIGIEIALRIFKDTWIKVAAVAGILFAFVMIWGALVHMGG